MIIPVFNGEALVQRAVESALGQTHAPLEIIALDDGSTDRSAAILRGLPVTYVYQENQGLAAARNAAISQARADYIALLDHDDVWLPEKLERQLAALDADPGAGYALCHHRFLFDDGKPPDWFHQRGPDEGEPSYAPSSWLIRRHTWERVGPFSTNQATEDIDWLARAIELGERSVMVPEVLMLKGIHGANMTGDARAIKRGFLSALRAHVVRSRASRNPS